MAPGSIRQMIVDADHNGSDRVLGEISKLEHKNIMDSLLRQADFYDKPTKENLISILKNLRLATERSDFSAELSGTLTKTCEDAALQSLSLTIVLLECSIVS